MNTDLLSLVNRKLDKYEKIEIIKPEPINRLPWKKELDKVDLSGEDCPSCGKHSLKIKGTDANCSGCKKEFFLVEKIKEIDEKSQKKWMCLDCGHTVNDIERPIVSDSKKCPSCNKKLNFKLVEVLIENEARELIKKAEIDVKKESTNDKSKKE